MSGSITNLRTITAANSVYSLVIPGLYQTPQQLQGFMADRAFETEDVEPVETPMGVDGHMSVGFIPVVTMQTISIMPDSVSSDLFENWWRAQQAKREVYLCNGSIILPGSQKKYSMYKGALSRVAQVPGVMKVLQGRGWRITWESVFSAPYTAGS